MTEVQGEQIPVIFCTLTNLERLSSRGFQKSKQGSGGPPPPQTFCISENVCFLHSGNKKKTKKTTENATEMFCFIILILLLMLSKQCRVISPLWYESLA